MIAGARIGEQTALFQSLLLFGGLLLVLLLTVVVALYLRRRLRRPDDVDLGVMSLDELRRLRDQGALSVGEYERLRARTIEVMSGGTSSGSGEAVR